MPRSGRQFGKTAGILPDIHMERICNKRNKFGQGIVSPARFLKREWEMKS